MAELWGLFEVSCPEELVDGKQHVFLAFWTQQTVDFMILIVLIHILRMPLAIGKWVDGAAYQACGNDACFRLH